ncbi:MAG: GNAT family N-acetyltransferase [Acidimicrobiia bacterium]|nr:GNAT family N-acetyltransferase [Acidimicrobiia bacterium]
MVRTRDPAVVEFGAERARVVPWRGSERTAYLAPVPDAPPPSRPFIERCVHRLAAQGYAGVVTPALAPAEQRPFLLAGFEPHERLHLLAHDLLELPPVPRGASRRARRGDRAGVLAVDRAAFSSFWRLDQAGLQEALEAVPVTRFRVSTDDDGGAIVAYAVTGTASRQGYLQRLAVDPVHQRAGRGLLLVADALRWIRRHGAARAVVNTQLGNEAALSLYTRVGFREQPGGLAVLRRALD